MLDPNIWSQAKRVFHEAMEHPPSQRAAFVARACGGDDQLRNQVEHLLEGEGKVEPGFMEPPSKR